jgi:hypothetical protein
VPIFHSNVIYTDHLTTDYKIFAPHGGEESSRDVLRCNALWGYSRILTSPNTALPQFSG